jgi:Heat induced stress protein YflT domain
VRERKTDRPVRVGVYSTVQQADRAVKDLLAAGFTTDQISVVCSDRHKEKLFGEMAHPVHTARQTAGAIATGGAVGATLGGLALAATAIATGGASLLAAGTVLVGGGALAGSFTGAMMTRGFEKEIADYYDAEVRVGKILVAVEVEGEGNQARLAQAERILAAAGAEPIPLVEG